MIKAMTDDLVFAHIMSCKKEYVKRLIHYITNIPLEKLQDLKYLKIMILEDEKELIKISKGDDILKDVIREMIHYDAMDVPFGYRDVDEEHEWMMNSIRDRHKEELEEEKKKSLEKGAKTEKLNNARNLLNLGVQPEIILKATGLTNKQLNKLKTNQANINI